MRDMVNIHPATFTFQVIFLVAKLVYAYLKGQINLSVLLRCKIQPKTTRPASSMSLHSLSMAEHYLTLSVPIYTSNWLFFLLTKRHVMCHWLFFMCTNQRAKCDFTSYNQSIIQKLISDTHIDIRNQLLVVFQAKLYFYKK